MSKFGISALTNSLAPRNASKHYSQSVCYIHIWTEAPYACPVKPLDAGYLLK